MATPSGCDVCKKSSLSLLLLRPSPISKSPLLLASGSQSVAAEPASVAGLLPSRLPTEARFGLRLLREGYVHVYIPNPPPRMTHWRVYRVTQQADLVPQEHALFSQPGEPVACERPGHIATGMKVLNIPQADKIAEIWIAYSANLWNETLRKKNAGDAAVMQHVSLRGSGPNTFTPTAQKLKAQVLECALTSYIMDGSAEQDFSFNSVAKSVDQLAAGLAAAAATHPKTAGKEVAVVLRDPVAIAAELNSLRIRRNELIKREFSKPEVQHPLNSSNTILGLKQSVVDEAEAASFDEVTPIVEEKEFGFRTWPPGTNFKPISSAEREMLLKKPPHILRPLRKAQLLKNKLIMGWVIYPDVAERAAEWTKKKSEQNWSKFERYLNEDERKNWLATFNKKLEREHYEPLQKMEDDWFSAAIDPRTVAYFDRHFDSESKASLLNPPVDSVTYAIESKLIHQPAPISKGTVNERYVALLDKSIADPSAIVQRALAGNKKELFSAIHEQLTGDPGAEGMRDKTYDILKGFSELNRVRPSLPSHGWIAHALALYSIGQITAFTGAVLAVAGKTIGGHPSTARAVARLQAFILVQKIWENVVEGALKGTAPKLPVLIKFQVDANEALAMLAARSGQDLGTTKSKLKKYRAQGRMVTLTLLTDTDAIKAANGNLQNVANDATTGSVKMGSAATATAITAATGKATILSKDAFMDLYQGQASRAARAANVLRDALPALNRTVTGANVLELSKTLDARLALGSMAIQIIGMWNGIQAMLAAKTDSDRLDAAYGAMDSVMGFTGGAVQMATLFGEIRLINRVAAQTGSLAGQAGANAVAQSVGIGLLKFLGNATGAAGGVINYLASTKKAGDQYVQGNDDVAALYRLSAIASAGTGLAAGALMVGSAAQTLSANAVGGAVVRTVATRLAGGAVVGTIAGVGLTVSGIGLVLLGAGVLFQVGAVVLTPSDTQRWVARSYFGNSGFPFYGDRDDKFPKGNWTAERQGLEELLKGPVEDEK